MVLVVDDNLDIREAVVDLLADHGIDAISAQDGKDALAQAKTHPDLQAIVLDLSMPHMDGESFRARQLEDPGIASVPVIVVSAERDIERAASRMGACAALAKPFHPDTLLCALRACA